MALKQKIVNEVGATIYPLTDSSQVIVSESGERLNGQLAKVVYFDSFVENGLPETVDADTLGGKPASYYATAESVKGALKASDVANFLRVVSFDAATGTLVADMGVE